MSPDDRSAQPLRVVVADDQTVVREGLVTMLNLLPDVEVVGAAADGHEAVALVAEHNPDVALIDLHMPLLDGIGVTERVTTAHPSVAVIVLTTFADDTSILAALNAGARSYLTKDATRADIARALHAAAAGQSVFDHAVQTTLLQALANSQTVQASAPPSGAILLPSLPQPLPDGLTSREAEVLLLIARGLTNAQIADTLYISRHTIKTHVNRIFAKTGSRSREDATRYAEERLGPLG